tara:strand:- start:587 stop:1999 length:1413 start_codon:yes stop_codon:yes gene_type:complete
MGRLSASALNTTYKDLVFQKEDNKIYYTNSSDVDTELTTFASPMTFSGKITASLGLELDNNIIYASDGGATITLDTSDNVAITGDLIITGNDIKSGNIGSSTTAITLSGANAAIAGDLTVSGNDIKSNGGTTAITLSSDDATVVGDLTITGTSSGTMTLGADADGVDRSIVFGHTTLKSIMGIDDSQDVFAINTDAAFESVNDFEIDASGNVTIKGDLTITGGNITNALTLDSTLAVSGLATLSNNLTFSGTTPTITVPDAQGLILKGVSSTYVAFTSSSATHSKASTFSGAVTCSSTLAVSGVTSLSGNSNGAAGTGLTAASDTTCKASKVRMGDIIYTNIILDVHGQRSDSNGAVIGTSANANPSYLTRISTSSNGTLLCGRVTCLEAPTADLEFFTSTSLVGKEGDTASGLSAYDSLCVKSSWAAGDIKEFDNTAIPADGEVIYMEGTATTDYGAGKFIIEMWGVAS